MKRETSPSGSSNDSSDSGEGEYLPGPVPSALLASLPLQVILFAGPATIYIANQVEFGFRYAVILHLGCLHLVIVLCAYIVLRLVPRLRRAIGYPLAVVGAYLFGILLLAPYLTDANLHAGIYFVEESRELALVEVGMLALLWVLIRSLPAPKLVAMASVFSVLLAVAVSFVVVVEAGRTDPAVSGWEEGVAPAPARGNSSPNVYHLVFDGYDGTLFSRIVSELDMRAAFAGFTLYDNVFSNYTVSFLSFPSFMTGRLYDKAALDGLRGRLTRSEGLVKTLVSSGYFVTQYNAHYINNHSLAHERHSTVSIETAMYGNLRHLVQLLDLSLLLVAPQMLKQQTSIDGRGLFSHWFLRARFPHIDWSRNPPLLSLMLLDQMIEGESRRPDHGQYVTGHFLLPHAPESVNAQCEFVPQMQRLLEHLAEQTICATRKMQAIASALRELERFRDAMVIIHSDHGTLRRSRPVLLVKYPGADVEPMQVVDYEVQLVDVAPTILDAVGIDYAGLDGVNLRDDRERADKDRWRETVTGAE